MCLCQDWKNIRNINKVAKVANIFQLIGQVSSKYTKHFSLEGKLNAHIDIELMHAYHDGMIIWLIIKLKDLTLISKSMIYWTIGVVVGMSILDTKVAGSNLSIDMFSPWARDFICIASVDSAVKWVPGGDKLVKGVQCYELFGGIALKNHAFLFFIFIYFSTMANIRGINCHWKV